MNHRSFGLAGLVVLGIAITACGDDTSATGAAGAGGGGGDPTTTASSTASTTGSTATTTATTSSSGGGEGGSTTTTTGAGGAGGSTTTTTTTTGVGGGSAVATGVGGSGGDSCAAPTPAAVPSVQAGDNTGAPSVSGGITCNDFTGSDGPEIVYLVTPSFTGTLQVALTGTTADHVLYAETTCGDAATIIACADDGTDAEDETMFVPVTINVPVYIYVDGYFDDSEGPFSLSLEEIPAETVCDDFTDNDFDDLIDCEDPTACQSLAACVSGPGATGAACTVNSNCAANASDPVCVTDHLGFEYPGGYCSEFCNLVADDCTGDAICLDVLDLPSGNGVCADGCVVDADCRFPQYTCEDIGVLSDVCRPSSCGFTTPAVLGANSGDNSTGISSETSACISGSATAQEQIFTFTPATSGSLTITVTTGPGQADLGIAVRTACSDPATEVGCTEQFGPSTPEVLVLPNVVSGVQLFIIVDGYFGSAGPFTMTIAQP